MATEREWHDRIRDLLNERIERRDVWLALRVDADPAVPFDVLDDEEFADWVEDWIGFTVASTAGPVMPGTAETEWVVGDNEELRISLLLNKRSDPEGALVVD
jgi:hypothetical protein